MDKIKQIGSEIELWLKEYLCDKGSYEKNIYEAMAYSLEAGGKKIRPILFLNTYSLYKEDYKKVMPIAAAIEMIHTYSLIHDDLPAMDNDDLRRGKPTNHKVFGEAIAILAGDALLNEAMNIMFEYSLKNGENALKACYTIAKAAGVEGMIGGQVVDILSEDRSIPVDELYYMHKKKTGALIKASILAGAILASVKSTDIELLGEYGDNLGLAFQIKDDILDVEGDTTTLGKKVKSDEDNHKTTFVKVYGIEKCNELCTDITNKCFNLLNKLEKNTDNLKEITTFLLNRKY
ncbi:polyprenyl synthetase family protein [Clostridium sporogenes]|uniref:Farnesyl diphosphate synthase n=1 Tax=Clostridium botulinum TaxID=1491 RepID=A0A6M0T1V2_CLOBO|nr:farnesyl diphosphate synthase [Clostridium sporogenes]NFA61343.1 polyprenyl synthetase family protein [Clostridium botulinum]NFI74936.1 polyprenyl synthetase family protein [Clostridium sporogenes]NFL73237.1 polyprenyl synthetase family protein [Clostridium sporogenes]NFM25634.1 polyprenyl synthetase family protein [Clostridium sporogenes]NFP63527.1 polyprenyl synthetase family protein [Clostridium sporogenes]